MLEHLKYRFIRTPLEAPLMAVREFLKIFSRLRHPELAEVFKEPKRIDELLERALEPDSNCLDIGAHYGSTLSAMLRLAPRGHHTAVEAIPNKVEFLRSKFPEVKIHNLALGSEAGTVDFFINTRRTGFSGMAQHGSSGDTFEKIEIPCETLDNLMAEATRVDFVKIDVEGAEEMVLRSGSRFLEKHRPMILFECGPSGAASFGREPVDVYRLLTGELGYDVFYLKDWLAAGSPVDEQGFESALVYPFKAFNWIAQARSR